MAKRVKRIGKYKGPFPPPCKLCSGKLEGPKVFASAFNVEPEIDHYRCLDCGVVYWLLRNPEQWSYPFGFCGEGKAHWEAATEPKNKLEKTA